MVKYKRLDVENILQHIVMLTMTQYKSNMLSRLIKLNILTDEEQSKIKNDLNIEINKQVYTDLINIIQYTKNNN